MSVVPEPIFLTLAEVMEVHKNQVDLYGGSVQIRDLGLLESAVAMPQHTFRGEFLHGDLFEMAAAYAYHISEDQPFIDGNKRTGLASALVFLEMNKISLKDPEVDLLYAMRQVSRKRLDKNGLAQVLRKLASAHRTRK